VLGESGGKRDVIAARLVAVVVDRPTRLSSKPIFKCALITGLTFIRKGAETGDFRICCLYYRKYMDCKGLSSFLTRD
jgi:hypothetical protein